MKRPPYRKGATAWLRSLKKGETREFDSSLNWRSTQSIAAELERVFSLKIEYTFFTENGIRYVLRKK